MRKMRRSSTHTLTCSIACSAIAALFFATQSLAYRFEEIGPPENIDLADGSVLFVEGVGLDGVLSGEINIYVPAEATVKQVLLYWAGRASSLTDPGDSDTITVNLDSVTGMRIGSSSSVLPSHAYRADITDKGWISSGSSNLLTVSGLDFAYQNDGAAVVVIADDGSMTAIQIVDGNDFAYLVRSNQTEAVDFPVAAADVDRVGVLKLIVTDIATYRPAAVDITVDGVTTRYDDILKDNEGEFLDVVELDVLVPAGVTNVTAQLLSTEDGFGTQPASLAWLFGSFEIAEPVKVCGGGGLTPGFWQNKHGLGYIQEYGALNDLNELCLRDDDGAHADFATLHEFRAWIKTRRALNMSYQLSGHLAAMYMNVLIGSVDGDALVYIGHEGDMISIYNLLYAANITLCEDGETFDGDENRYYQEMLKNALDAANNNLNWVNPCICHE